MRHRAGLASGRREVELSPRHTHQVKKTRFSPPVGCVIRDRELAGGVLPLIAVTVSLP